MRCGAWLEWEPGRFARCDEPGGHGMRHSGAVVADDGEVLLLVWWGRSKDEVSFFRLSEGEAGRW